MKSVISASQFSLQDLERLLSLSSKLEEALRHSRQLPLLNDYILATLFFEPSTRTRLSFESAMHRLGGRVISAVGVQFSSLAKGETLFDTVKMVESYADIAAIRHSTEGASDLAARSVSIPIINAGDGAGEHPTQALLDLYTIRKYKPLGEKKITVSFVGDIRYGRTIHSLVQLLAHFDTEMIFVSPQELSLPDKYRTILEQQNISIRETENIMEILDSDVTYVTRIQEERFLDRTAYERFKNMYVVNREIIEQSQRKTIVMHPLPRLNEISIDLDDHPSAVYFDQATNGLYARMALLLDLLEIDLRI